MYSLIASDLDGTLMLPSETFGAFTQEVMHRLSDAGHHLVLATGRHQADVEALLNGRFPAVHMITANGARVASACGGLSLSQDLAAETVQLLLEETRNDPELVINLFCPSGWLMSGEASAVQAYSQGPGLRPAHYALEQLPLVGVQKVFFFQQQKDHEALLRLQAHLEQRLAGQIGTVFTAPWCLEVMALGVSKGLALQQLVDFLEVPIQACIAFGDGLNDTDMLASVGKGVLMGNAYTGLRQALPAAEVIGDCTEEAVARYLARHVLDKRAPRG